MKNITNMNFVNIRLLLICLFYLIISSSQGQDLNTIKINGIYSMPMDQFFDTLSLRYNLKLEYNREVMHQVDLDWFFSDKSLADVLKEIAKERKLVYTIDDKNVIHFTTKEALRNINVIAEEKSATTYSGPSERKNVSITGRVVEAKSLESLPFVTISVGNSSLTASSNADGFFTLLNVPTDTAILRFSYLGYNTRYVPLNPKMNLNNIIVGLTAQSQELKEVTVQAEKEKQDLLQTGEKPGMIKMTPQKLDVLPNLGEKDIFRSFQLMPGVSAANESSSGLYVRGSTPDQALVLYDGFTIYHVDHLFGFFSAFNANAIKDVQLYRGGFESKFGGRLGSVAEITGNEGNRKKWDCGFDISLLGVNGWLAIPIKEKFTSLIAFRTSYEGYIYNLIYKKFDNSNTSNTNGPGGGKNPFATQDTKPSSNFYDLNIKLGYKFGKSDINNITLSIFNSRDKLDNSQSTNLPSFGGGSSFSSSSTDLTKYGSTGGSIKYSRKFNEKIYGNTLLSISEYNSNRDLTRSANLTDSSGNTKPFKNGTLEHNTLLDLAFKTDYEFKLTNWNKLEVGVLLDYYHISYNYSQNDTSTIISRDNKGSTSAIYLQDNFSLFKSRLNILIGSRVTYFSRTNKPYFEPRASIDLKIAKGLKFQAATGLYYQFANRVIREDILQGSKDFWVLSDGSKIPVSSSVHYIAGFNYEVKWFTFSVEAYYKNLYNLSQYSLRLKPSIGKISYDESFYKGNGIAKGIDYTIMLKIKGYNGWVTYTLGKVDYDFAAFGGVYPADQDVRHEFKTTHTYKLWRFDISATWMFSTGKPYTAPQGGYQLTLLDGTTQSYINVSSKNGERLPNYHRLDLAVSYRHPLKTGGNIGIGISIFNAYNRNNVWYRTYQIEDSKVVQTNVNYLGIIPNLTLSFKLR